MLVFLLAACAPSAIAVPTNSPLASSSPAEPSPTIPPSRTAPEAVGCPVTLPASSWIADLTGLNYGVDIVRWRDWWRRHRDLSEEQWLEARLAHQASRTHRLEGDLDRARAQIVRLHQQLYSRLPAADRLGHVQTLLEHEDPEFPAATAGKIPAARIASG